MNRRPWSVSDDRRLEAMWNDATPTKVIAAVLGRSKGSVIGRAHRLGLAHHDLYQIILPDDLSSDWEAYQRGEVTTVDIAKRYGVTPKTICVRFDREGWQRRPRSEYMRLRHARRAMEAAE